MNLVSINFTGNYIFTIGVLTFFSGFEIAFPELANPQNVLAEKQDIQIELQPEVMQICDEEMGVDSKDTPLKKGCTKVISKNIGSGKKKSLPVNKKEHKRKNLSRFSKMNNYTENKSETSKMNIEESINEFFDKFERTGNIKRNLIY